jgi:hypothetical protein
VTHWVGDHAWITEVRAEYRWFVYHFDVVRLRGTVTGTRIGTDGDHVADISTEAVKQRGEVVMPGRAVIARPGRSAGPPPAARRAGMLP